MDAQTRKQNILIIRSATRIMNQTLDLLKREFPHSRITVLAPAKAVEAVSPDPRVDEVLAAPERRRMSALSYGWRNIRELRRRRFDLAVSLYNVDHGLGYSNIDILAWASGAPRIRGYNPKGRHQEFSGGQAIRKSLLEKTTVVWVLLNALATVFLFACITCGLVGEWCVRQAGSRARTRQPASGQEPLPPGHDAPPAERVADRALASEKTPESAKVMTRV